MTNSKVKSVEVTGDWEKDGKVYYRHQYTMEDGKEIQANHTSKLPFAVGVEVEYEVTRTHEKYGDSGKVKNPNDFKKGNYKKPTLSFKDIKRMVKTNAVHAVDVVNANYNEHRLDGKSLKEIEKFTLGDISGDIEKYSEEDSLLTSRLASVNNAAIASGYESVNNVSELIELAEKRYKYVKS